jgi:hypothetical protein
MDLADASVFQDLQLARAQVVDRAPLAVRRDQIENDDLGVGWKCLKRHLRA